jgi:hypothetical protein
MYFFQGSFYHTLNGSVCTLSLPSAEIGAVIGNKKFDISAFHALHAFFRNPFYDVAELSSANC